MLAYNGNEATIEGYILSFLKNIACFFILSTIVSGVSHAQQGLRSSDALDSLFTIRSIKINEIAKSASVARRVGLAKAEEYAFDRLMKKILSAEGVAALPEISIQDKQNMMRGIEIVSERRSNRHYIAEVNIGCEPPEVSQWLADQNIPHVLGAGTGLLVLHVHQEGLLNYLWEVDGPHLKAWSQIDFINRLRSYRFPKGELRDRTKVSYQQVINHAINPTASMARDYKLDGALLMVTKQLPPSQTGTSIEYSYYLTDMKLGGEGVISLLVAGLDHLYSEFGVFDKTQRGWPMIQDLLAWLRTAKLKGRAAMWQASAEIGIFPRS